MYHIGDWVVRSTDGLCRIENVTNLDFVSDSKKLYYQLIPEADPNGKVYVPVESAQETMRPVMSLMQAKELIQQIPLIKESWIVSERERQNHYKQALQSNDPKQLIGIIKLIYQRKLNRKAHGKKMTTVDEQYFKAAERKLYSELEYALGKNKEDIEQMIKESCEALL